MSSPIAKSNRDRLLLRVPEAARLLSVSRSTIYKLIRNRQLLSVKLEGSRRIPLISLYQFVINLLKQTSEELREEEE